MKPKPVETLKSAIYYPREYRHLPQRRLTLVFYLLLCMLPVVLIFVVFYGDISLTLCDWGSSVIASVTGETVNILAGDFIPWFGKIHYLEMEGAVQPSFMHAAISAAVSLAAVLITSRVNNSARPFMIYLCVAFFVQLVSSLLFLFIPQMFPYTITDYSGFYMKQQLATWIMVSLIAGIVTGMLDPAGFSKFAAFFLTVIYIFIYGCLRYVLYLIVLRYFSLMYMATLFFTFGIFIDFLQLVAIYAIFAKHVSTKMNAGRGYSDWLWS